MAVASCSKLRSVNPQSVWSEIAAQRPDVLLLLGDTVYLEHDHHDDPLELAAELRALYAAQLQEPNFAALRQDILDRGGRIVPIYDDHDFIGNDRYGGDHSPSLGEAARTEFIRAFAPPQTGKDVFRLEKAGPVDIIVLDQRFYRKHPLRSAASREAILGSAQWAWFESQVASSNAKFLVVASSTTLHTYGNESWEMYPAAFRRIRDLLKGRKGHIVLSGDVHRNAVYDDSGVIEIVTSAVARNGLMFGSPRKNYGILTFRDDRVRVELKSLKVGWRFDFEIPLNRWELP